MTRRLVRRILGGSFIWILTAGAVIAVVRVVDDDPGAQFSSVQEAIDASAPGDEVSVRCGLYSENIRMKDGVSVIGERPECAILEGLRFGTVVTFVDVRQGTEFSGFTVRNGRSFEGGGIFLDGSSPLITRTFIVGNEAIKTFSGYFGVGGGISAYDSHPIITNSLIAGNVAEAAGGGVDMYFSYPTLTSNTIVGNRAGPEGSGDGFGGGIYGLFSDPTVVSNIIFNNASEAGGGGIDLFNSPFFTVEYNDIYGNSPTNTSGLPTPPGPGNISLDPLLLATPSFNRCPRSHSPVLDLGPPLGTTDLTDFFGRARQIDGDFDGFLRIDMGYCEGGDITNLAVKPGGALNWDPSISRAAVYNLYRGVVGELRRSCQTRCIYTQDSSLVPGARRECDLLEPAFTDAEDPPPGEAYYYLVTGSAVVEGVLGFRSDGSALDNDNPCL